MKQRLPSFWSILWISLFLAIIGWGGLLILVFITLPTLAPRWAFFFLLTLGLSGTALPVTYFLNRRFPTDPPVEGGVVLREAMWVGVYGSLLAWLQMGHVLTSGFVLVLAAGLLLVEFLLRLSERSQWSPSKAPARAPAGGPSSEPDAADEADLDDEFDEDEYA